MTDQQQRQGVKLTLTFESYNYAQARKIAMMFYDLKIKVKDNNPEDEYNYVNIHKTMQDSEVRKE